MLNISLTYTIEDCIIKNLIIKLIIVKQILRPTLMFKYKTFKRFVTIIIAVLCRYMDVTVFYNHMHCASMNNTIDIRIWPQKQDKCQ